MELFRLKKKYAKTNIVFEENEMDEDGWFIDINSVDKHGKIKNCITIIRSDLDSRLNSYINDGWVKIEKTKK